MTRFARAKGSKASNEKLPEPATSWSEMKQELLDKNKELEEKKNHEKAMLLRQANYQAFLQEKEDEEVKNISWANFPEAQNSVKKQKTPNTDKKRKVDTTEAKSSESQFKNKKFKKLETSSQSKSNNSAGAESDESDGEFLMLKSQIDKVLDSQNAYDSDSDAPPEETSVREKPQEIIVKKPKKPKQKLQILINQEDKSAKLKNEIQKNLQGKIKEIKVKEGKKENLTGMEKKKIEKKQERYIKQLEKKKLKRLEKKIENAEVVDDKVETDTSINVAQNQPISENLDEIDAIKLQKKLERRKKQKEKKLKKKQEAGLLNTLENKKEKDEVLTEKDLAKIQKKKERRARQAEKRKKIREAKALASENADFKKEPISEESTNGHKEHYLGKSNLNNNTSNELNKFQNKFSGNEGNTEGNTNLTENKSYQKDPNTQKEKKAKLKNNKDFQRKKAKPEIMFINGKTVEIDYVDGFPVKKEDADRLKKLRKEMISRGLPRSEINISLKLERRKAEKALTREKKNVCFNCRKSGHNLSECPALNNDQVAQTSGTGICFKCGSTEHTHFECKVVKGLEYKFATCFICKEQGHISRQCPDNQRGLYPKGGACKVCGDVTHLKKDCPKFQAQQNQLQSSLSIETLDNRNPDDLGSKGESRSTNLGPVKKLNKIKF